MGLFDRFRKPKNVARITFTDPQFGVFAFIKDLCWFEGIISIQGKEISVTLETKESVKALHHIYPDIENLIEKASRYAAETLLDGSNVYGYDAWANEIIDEHDLPHMTEGEFNVWLNQNLPDKKYIPLKTDDFIKHIRLLSIHLSECGAYSLVYDDGDLFWGHQISVGGDMKSGFTNADI